MNDPRTTRIENYLNDTLPPEERLAFEAALSTDPELDAEVRLHRVARLAVNMQSLLERRERLQAQGRRLLRSRLWWWKMRDWAEDTFTRHNTEGFIQLQWGRIALASLSLLLLAFGTWWLLQVSQESEAPLAAQHPQELYQKHYKRLEINNTLGANEGDSYTRARQQYIQGHCAEAVRLLDKVLAEPTFESRPMALLLKGTCLLEMGQAADALQTLRQVTPIARGAYQEAAWYMALAHLQLGQRSQAAEQLQQIAAQPRHPYAAQAKALLGVK